MLERRNKRQAGNVGNGARDQRSTMSLQASALNGFRQTPPPACVHTQTRPHSVAALATVEKKLAKQFKRLARPTDALSKRAKR